MTRPTHFRLRWKGAITGPFALPRISELLRAGEISLLHNIEVEGSWFTVRDYFRAIGYGRNSQPPAGELPSLTASGFENNPGLNYPEATSLPSQLDATGDLLERAVREGYLWCGATFLLPPGFALLVYLSHLAIPDLSPTFRFVLLWFTTAMAVGLPIIMVRKVGLYLEQEGLGEIRQTQFKLVWILALLGFGLWLMTFYFLVMAKG